MGIPKSPSVSMLKWSSMTTGWFGAPSAACPRIFSILQLWVNTASIDCGFRRFPSILIKGTTKIGCFWIASNVWFGEPHINHHLNHHCSEITCLVPWYQWLGLSKNKALPQIRWFISRSLACTEFQELETFGDWAHLKLHLNKSPHRVAQWQELRSSPMSPPRWPSWRVTNSSEQVPRGT